MALDSLRALMKIRNFTSEELAEQSGVPKSTIDKIASGHADNPSYKNITSIANALSLTVDELANLLSLGSSITSSAKAYLSNDEQRHINKYRALDAYGKEIVDSSLSIEYKRCITPVVKPQTGNVALFSGTMVVAASQNESVKDNADEDEGELYRQYDASAGNGYWADEDNFELIRAKDAPRNAKLCVKLSGDSMEPRYENGDVVWIDTDAIAEEGEVGIFVYEGHAYCKKLIRLQTGQPALHSLNPNYDDIMIHDYDDFRCVGKVL